MKRIIIVVLLITVVLGGCRKKSGILPKPDGDRLACSYEATDGTKQEIELTYTGTEVLYALSTTEIEVEPEYAETTKKAMDLALGFFTRIRGLGVELSLNENKTLLIMVMSIDLVNLDYKALAKYSDGSVDKSDILNTFGEGKDVNTYRAEMEADGWTCR